MMDYQELIKKVRAGRVAGKTTAEIALDLDVKRSRVIGIVHREKIGLPEEARARIEQTRRARLKLAYMGTLVTKVPCAPSSVSMTKQGASDEESFVFDIEARFDAWDAVGPAYMDMDDSY